MSRAPVVSLSDLCGPRTVVVIAPHPDDETLGCGGLVCHRVDAGLPVVIVVLTDGAASHPNSRTHPPKRLADVRRQEACLAAARLGAPKPLFFGEPDGALVADAVVPRLDTLCRDRDVGTIVAPWAADPHPDHKAAHQAAHVVALRTGARLLAYPIWGLTLAPSDDAGPAMACARCDVAAVLDRKRSALQAYRSQLTDLINDDPAGFRLRGCDLDRHLGRYESFFGDDAAQPLLASPGEPAVIAF